MARLKKRGESGAAKNFVTRNQALKKLQVSLSDFRRLCILKGIHPQQPRHVKRANKGSTAPASFFYAKDIQYLAHEPILRSLREHKTFAKKLSRAVGRREWAAAKNLDDAKPQYTLDHIIKQRYPTFDEAIGDIDDALCMIALFANLPAKMYNLPEGVVDTCARLKREWDEYIVRTKALNKTFLSIKGIYFQATFRRKDVTWLVPYPFTQHVPHDVDFRIMSTFLELYTTLLSFVNFKLWSDLGESYPPNLDQAKSSSATASTSASSSTLSKKAVRKAVRAVEHEPQPVTEEAQDDDDEKAVDAATAAEDASADFAVDGSKPGIDTLPLPSSESSEETRTLFRNCTVYLDRSTPLSLLSFILRSYGSFNTRIGWDETLAPNSPLREDDVRITHVIIDRPELDASKRREGRKYVQPQWVVDCANRGTLLPEDKYAIGATLPPHMSPFVEGEVIDEDEDAGEASASSDEEGEEAEEEPVDGSRPALQALLAAADDPDTAHDDGLVDAAELEAESMGGEAELDRVRAAWLKATGGAGGASTASASADAAPEKKKKQGGAKVTAAEQEEEEARKMARGLLSNRQRKLYDKMSYTKAKKAEEAERLAKRRDEIKRDERRKAKAAGK